MKGLKTLVILMGLLIVVGLGLVGYGVSRHRKGGEATAPDVGATSAAPGKAGYFASEVPVPHGAHLEQVTATGDRLILRFTGGEGEKGDRLILVDVHNGQVTGTVILVPESH
jgi:hypothetical protein